MYHLEVPSVAQLEVFDLLGRMMETIKSGSSRLDVTSRSGGLEESRPGHISFGWRHHQRHLKRPLQSPAEDAGE